MQEEVETTTVPCRNELVQHKQKNDELAGYIKKQKLKYQRVCNVNVHLNICELHFRRKKKNIPLLLG